MKLGPTVPESSQQLSVRLPRDPASPKIIQREFKLQQKQLEAVSDSNEDEKWYYEFIMNKMTKHQ